MTALAPNLELGQVLAAQRYRVTRADLVRYAGAAGDFNPIHWSDRTAHLVGLPDDEGTEVEVAGTVRAVSDGTAQIDLTVTCAGEKVLAMARATVRTAASA